MRIHIPEGAYMRYRKQGRYVFGQKLKNKPITWLPNDRWIPEGATVYTVAWQNGQTVLMASGTYRKRNDHA